MHTLTAEVGSARGHCPRIVEEEIREGVASREAARGVVTECSRGYHSIVPPSLRVQGGRARQASWRNMARGWGAVATLDCLMTTIGGCCVALPSD